MHLKVKVILDLCGGTGSWSKPYRDAGYDVCLITLPENDVRSYEPPENVYGVLAAPPCTMFSFARTNAKKPRDLREGMETVEACLRIIWKLQYKTVSDQAKYTRLKFWALENPYFGFLKNFMGEPAMVFDPFEFGDAYKKRTALWGNFNRRLKRKLVAMTKEESLLCKTNSYLQKFDRLKTQEIHPEMYGILDRQARRAITPKGFAKAFYDANN